MFNNAPPGVRSGPEWDRRTFLKASGITIGGVSLAALVAACGGARYASGGPGGDTLTLKMPFLADMQVPDPDIMYEGEGAQLMEFAYEGLVRYQPGSAEIIPQLAKSWTLSPDQLTYTFTLEPTSSSTTAHRRTPRPGSRVSSAARRSTRGRPTWWRGWLEAAPDATTFVVTLKEPNNAFLHYLACPWQPFAVSPTAVEKNAVGDDLAQEWLKTHDAGSGPYTITEFVPGSHYTLAAFPDYRQGKPPFESIRINITPDVTTQKLQLDSGAFDLVSKGFAIPDVLAYQQNPQFTVVNCDRRCRRGALAQPELGHLRRQGAAQGTDDRPGPQEHRRHRLGRTGQGAGIDVAGRSRCRRRWPRSPPRSTPHRSRRWWRHCRPRRSTWPGPPTAERRASRWPN